MIARSALPFSVGDVLDRVRQTVMKLRQHLDARPGGKVPPLPSKRQRAGLNYRGGSSRWQRIFEAYGDWSSLVDHACHGETRSRDQTESFRRFCHVCDEDTVHEEFDEFGPGWYAQICRCRRCGRQGMRIWPLACW
jgi:hypothetical protein